MTAEAAKDVEDNEMSEKSRIDIESYRKLVQNYIQVRRHKTALFWAEKASALSNFEVKDVYWQAQCMFLLKEYHRAASLIRYYGFEKSDVLCLYLLAECLYEAKEYQEGLDVLMSAEIEDLGLTTTTVEQEGTLIHLTANEENKNELLASICYIKGKILEAMDNRNLAMDSYVQALQKSVHCYEALDALVQHEMLMAWEERVLLDKLPIIEQCADGEDKILRKLYESKLKKYSDSVVPQTNAEITPVAKKLSTTLINELTEKMKNSRNVTDPKASTIKSNAKCFTPVSANVATPNSNKMLGDFKSTPSYSIHNSLLKVSKSTPDSASSHKKSTKRSLLTAISLQTALTRLNQSVDVMSAQAEKLFYNGEYKKSLKVIDDILKRDIYHTRSLTVKIECLMELKETTALFYLAHRLIDLYPDEAIAWYAVGCYYDLIGKSDQARRYLSKATSLDRLFGPAWLAYGHSFAKENEHDQAMAAYFKATQLMRGCHLPLLYIGVECGLTKNLEMAEKFFFQAMNIAPLDVFVLFELGVIKFEYELYESAEEIFRTTLGMVTEMAHTNGESISSRWEPLLNNLGHCCRKNKKYEEALEFHRRALILKPLSASTYTAFGFCQALMGRLEDAVESFHKSLSLKRDDVVTTTILKQVIEDLIERDNFVGGLMYDDIQAKETSMVTADETSTPTNRLNCVKLIRFDDDSNASQTSDNVDMSIDY
ncbi:cell division cycle protein 16 homolog [Culicoides brevitarsis]|uniref:cell division cycle protein 16 homolog n=1 Tax=Culicoides brevitarsis TaxID=469753 RepID=UPI00307C3E26